MLKLDRVLAFAGLTGLAEPAVVLAQASQLAIDMAMSRRGYPSRRGNIQRRAYKGRVIHSEVRDGRVREYHATKGWRCRAAA